MYACKLGDDIRVEAIVLRAVPDLLGVGCYVMHDICLTNARLHARLYARSRLVKEREEGMADGPVTTAPGPPNRPRACRREGKRRAGCFRESHRKKTTRISRYIYVRDEISRHGSAPDMLENDFWGSRHPPSRSLFLGKGRRAGDSAASTICIDIHVCVGFTVS